MRACKSKNSSIELALRKALWVQGYRYRTNYSKLPGQPDLVFTKAKVAAFCDGDFWHGKDWEVRKHDFRANKQFWVDKIERTIQRDQEKRQQLEQMGWLVLRFWESDINKRLDDCVATIRSAIAVRLEQQAKARP